MSGGSVQVDVVSLFNYGVNLAKDVIQQIGDLATASGEMTENTPLAFTQPASDGSVFAEGITAVHYTMRNYREFQGFLNDVRAGLASMQSAAVTLAVAYATTDSDSANSLNAVDFAFAGPGSTPLHGFPTKGVSTLEDQWQAEAEASGRNTMAATAASDPSMLALATGIHETDTGFLYSFADGSSLRVTYSSMSGSFYAGTTKVTTVTDSNHPGVTRTTTEIEGQDRSGTKTKTMTEDVVTADGKHMTSSTTMETFQDGSVTTTVTSVDADGKQHTTTTHAEPAKPADDAPTQDGIGRREQQLHSSGSDRGQAVYGT